MQNEVKYQNARLHAKDKKKKAFKKTKEGKKFRLIVYKEI